MDGSVGVGAGIGDMGRDTSPNEVRGRGIRGASVPAIALTAYTRTEDRVQALNAGFQLHVPKPVDPTELVATVASLRTLIA